MFAFRKSLGSRRKTRTYIVFEDKGNTRLVMNQFEHLSLNQTNRVPVCSRFWCWTRLRQTQWL